MEYTTEFSPNVESALALLSPPDRKAMERVLLEVKTYNLQFELKESWETELANADCNLERVGELAAAWRLLEQEADKLNEAAALCRANGMTVSESS